MTLLYTTLTLICFASNSILCRLALGGRTIDAASFTSVRMISGAVMLVAISAIAGRRSAFPSALSPPPSAFSHQLSALRSKVIEWRLALALFGYAFGFSFAYASLTASTGALILFGSVQATMLTAALLAGERPHRLEWLGLAAALTGVIVLTAPGLTSAPPGGALVMVLSGVCWGFYSLWGRGAANPLDVTTRNFVRVTPLSLLVSVAAAGSIYVTARGVLLAVASGAVASGVGYVLWYSALAGLTATRAATVQFAVPAIAALGGVVLLSEAVTVRLAVAAALILGGFGLANAGRR